MYYRLTRSLLMDVPEDEPGGEGSVRIGKGATKKSLETDLRDTIISIDAALDTNTHQIPFKLTEQLVNGLTNKYPCKTDRREIAVVLGKPKLGDRIYVARGSPCPLILRPAKQSDEVMHYRGAVVDRYELVGGAYVHEMMDGQILDEIKAGKVAENVIALV